MARRKKDDPPTDGTTATETPPTEASAPESNGNGNKPCQSFSLPAGNGNYIQASIWPKVLKTEGKPDLTVYSVTVRKSWRHEQSGEWQNSQFFRTTELFMLQYVLRAAEDWILSQRVQDSLSKGNAEDIPF